MPIFRGADYFYLDESLSEDEILARNTVREFVDEKVLPIIEKHYEDGAFPMHLVSQMASLGLFGSTLPAKYGCAEMNNVAYGLVMQELERGDSGIRSVRVLAAKLTSWEILRPWASVDT